MTPDLLTLVCVNAYELYCATLVGNPAPVVQRLHKEIANPDVGDLVLEISSIHRRDLDKARFGRLLRIEERPAYTADEWVTSRVTEDEPMPTIKTWVIESIDGGEIDWTDANFIKVLRKLFR